MQQQFVISSGRFAKVAKMEILKVKTLSTTEAAPLQIFYKTGFL